MSYRHRPCAHGCVRVHARDCARKESYAPGIWIHEKQTHGDTGTGQSTVKPQGEQSAYSEVKFAA
eukprot:1404333-Rhodomonas_salina.1